MSKKWNLIKTQSGGYMLDDGVAHLYFDEISMNEISWRLYQYGHLIAELDPFENEIVDYVGLLENEFDSSKWQNEEETAVDEPPWKLRAKMIEMSEKTRKEYEEARKKFENWRKRQKFEQEMR